MAVLWLMQAATALGAPVDFDLRRLPRPDGCTPGNGAEIVVCATPDATPRHRLPPLAPRPAEPLLPRAEFGIVGDIRGAVENESVELPGGVVSNRLMLRMKVPF